VSGLDVDTRSQRAGSHAQRNFGGAEIEVQSSAPGPDTWSFWNLARSPQAIKLSYAIRAIGVPSIEVQHECTARYNRDPANAWALKAITCFAWICRYVRPCF
jgi:hypothetical protein